MKERQGLNLQRSQRRLRKSLVERGAIGTVALAAKTSFRRLLKGSDPPKQYAAVHPFDKQFGVDTSEHIYAENLSSGRREDLHNNGYCGVAPSAFRQILDRLQLQFEDYTFVDLGSGKGRALLLASEYPFRAVIGVELSPKLHAIAVANIARFHAPVQRCRNVAAIEGDATNFSFPSGPLVLYLWNSFGGPVFTRVLANLETALEREPRELYVVYLQPELDRLLESSRFLRKLWRGEFPMSEEDYAAHAFPQRVEVCTVYRSVAEFR